MTRETKIILLSTLAMGTIVGLVMIRQRNRKELDEIIDKINTGQGATGTVDDLKHNNAFNPEYFKGKTGLLSGNEAVAQAKIIYNAKGIVNDDEDAVYGVFNRAKSKAVISQIAMAFQILYKVSMYDYIRSMFSDSEMQKLQFRIDQLK